MNGISIGIGAGVIIGVMLIATNCGKRNRQIFASYSAKYADGSMGFGNSVVGMNGKIRDISDIRFIQARISESLEQVDPAAKECNIVLLEWRECE